MADKLLQVRHRGSLMKSETKQTFRSPRWVALYTSMLMVVIGWLAAHGFDSLSRQVPPSGPPNLFDGRFDPETVSSNLLFFSGMLLCVVCCLWILIAALFPHARRDL